ncbi:cadherin-like protein 26 [Diretmus argenteus]
MTTTMAETLFGSHTMHKRGKRELLLRSKRRWVLSTIEIVEEDPGPFPKATTQMFNNLTDEERDSHSFRISGMGVDEEPKGVFSIDKRTGTVYVHKAIDRETHPFFHIKFDILHKGTNLPIDRTLAFDVEVKDINDNAPKFEHSVMTATIPENMAEGYLPVRLKAFDIDKDKTINSTFNISVILQEPKEPKFDVMQTAGTKHGDLTFTGCFDYDKVKKYKIIVQAKDHGIKPLSSTAVINVNIVDTNTHAPTFKMKEYHGNMSEMESNRELLRISVEDKDTPNTPGWRAKYFFIKGNEHENYKIETDPKTNDGILTVIKGKDYERTTLDTLQIGVENEQPLFVCRATPPPTPPPPNSVNIIIKVIDVNDPPEFDKDVTDVYQREEAEPGKVLYNPKVTDIDSNVANIRYELLEDPVDWVTIDEKTGQIKSAKKMDRESPFVDDNIYKVLIAAIDDGEPPATATGTILIHLGDINDNAPKLINQSFVMCINKDKSIMVPVEDSDAPPFSGPFTFALGGDDIDTLKQQWKLDPATGEAGGLVCLQNLAYGNYSVPLTIQDQQGMVTDETVEVVVCELLLLVIFCKYGRKKLNPIIEDEGNQTLIKYNEEGGGCACKTEPTLFLTSYNSVAVTDGPKLTTMQMPQMPPIMTEDTEMYRSSQHTREMPPIMTEDTEMYRSSQHNREVMAAMTHVGGTMGSELAGFSWSEEKHQERVSSLAFLDPGRYDKLERPVSPLLEPQFHRQQLPVPDVVVVLRRGEAAGEEAAGMELLVLRRALGQDSTHPHLRGVHLHQELQTGIRGDALYFVWCMNSMFGQQYWGTASDTSQGGQSMRLYVINGDQLDYPVHQPHEYAYEGQGSKCQSLDKLSLSNPGDDLEFLNDLGPKFKTLGGICHQTMQKKKIQPQTTLLNWNIGFNP